MEGLIFIGAFAFGFSFGCLHMHGKLMPKMERMRDLLVRRMSDAR